MLPETLQLSIDDVYRKAVEAGEAIEKVASAIKNVYTRDNRINDYPACYELHSSIKKINTLLVELNQDYIMRVENLIRSHYNLRFDAFNLSNRHIKLLSFEPVISPEIIITNITNQCGDFLDSGVKTLKQKESYYIKKATVTKNKLEFHSVYRFDEFSMKWNNRNRISNYESTTNLLKLILFFEFGDFDMSLFDFLDMDNVCISDFYYPSEKFKKLTKMRLYKNGKISLYFTDSDTANAFMKFIKSEEVLANSYN
jgi:hypothetical protein